MPPKKAQRKPEAGKASATATQAAKPEANGKPEASKDETGEPPQVDDKPDGTNTGDKRKQATRETKPKKEPRVGERKSARSSKQEVDVPKLINFLLSKEALAMSRPPDEKDAAESEQTYTSTVPMSPFEELLCACVLSRPISHRLGERSIRTIFNGDYHFRTPKAIQEAGPEKRLQAFYDARTQHKDKTAEQIGGLADLTIAKYAANAEDTSLEKLRKEGKGDVDALAEVVTKNIKGVGRTAIEIFFRRVQAHWDELYPYVDHRTKAALQKLDLPDDAEALQKLLQEHWQDIDTSSVKGNSDAEKERIVFVRLLERVTGTDLEGNSPDEVLKHVQ